MKIKKYTALLLAMLMALTLALPAFAQGEDTTDETTEEEITVLVEITGEVSFGEDDELMVGGVVVAPAGAFNPSELEEGMVITVVGEMLNDDTLQATEPYTLPEDVVADEEECVDADQDGVCDEEAEVTPEPEMTEEPEEPQEEELAEECVPDTHPVANAYAEEFELDVATVIGWHCDGNGFGEIGRALLLAEATDGDAEAFFTMRADGMGWGQILSEYDDVHPRDLAPGRVLGKDKNADDDAETVAPGNSGNAPGRSGEAPGNSGNAPGNSGNNANNGNNGNNGNSGNAPGNSGNNGNNGNNGRGNGR